jgi:DNA end-binding protein Ku
VTLASRERQVLMEPRGIGLLMTTLRSADEVRTAEFAIRDTGAIDPDMLAIAETIIGRAKGKFDPADFRDTYQDALRELVEAKLKGIVKTPRPIAAPPKVIDLMEALRRSLVQSGALPAPAKAKRAKVVDRRQPQLLMPVRGGGKGKEPSTVTEAPLTAAQPARRRKV